ncbi:uncharacterized protein [Diadema setosum]|uniref:uncharacterized protein n=1 Tax=Diadema setosum TaxID=31175 RepID=UPI003B3B2142
MALARFIVFAALIAVACAQYIDVDAFSVDSPSTIYGGASFAFTFDLQFTPTLGAADLIEASNDTYRFMVAITLSEDGSTLTMDGAGSASLSSSQQLVDMTDDSTVTWNNLEATMDLSNVDCGNGDTYQYLCVSVTPYPGVSWDSVDTSNSSMCISFVCKAVADVTVTTFTMTNPDDAVITPGGGQAIEFDMVVTNSDSSDDVSGSDNWLIRAYLSDSETGGTAVATETVSLSSSEMSVDVSAGSTGSFSDLAVTLDLSDVTCDDFDYACVSASPSSNAYWIAPVSGGSDNYLCISVTCGACIVKTSMAVMLVAVLLSVFFSH